MKERDWLLENLYNPHLDTYELSTMGELNTSNTQFLDRETYRRQDIIKEKFTDQNGIFQEDAFNNFYNESARKWQELQENKFAKGLELSMFDTDVRRTSRIKDNHFYLGEDINEYGMPGNPDRVKKGIEGFRTISDRTKTEAELAQSSNIYDPETGEFLDATPNDFALTKNPIKWLTDIVFGEPLALATYDEDEVDEYGIEHKKGEYKYNSDGTYYYEKLGDRSPIGKQILSIGDIITPENSTLNQIDFFDSDDLQKSVPGVIAKNVALLAPTFMGPTVAGYYYTAIIAKELSKSLPMLASLYSLIDSDYETPKWMNNLAAQGTKFSSNTSHYSKQNVFTFENIANLISDVSLQWGQQKKIAEAVSYFTDAKKDYDKAKILAKAFYDEKSKLPKLKGMVAKNAEDWENSVLGQAAINKFIKPVEESIRKRQQFGADLSLMYMATISNYDVYNTMLEKGANQQEAALVSAASTIGMFGVDKFLGLDKLFFDELTSETARAGRKILKEEYDEVIKNVYNNTKKKTSKEWFREGFDMGKSAVKRVKQRFKDRDLGILGKALGEGFEEVGEEFVTDMSKQLYDFGVYNYALGYDKTIKSSGAWENMAERYAMSLLGGFLGGGLYGIRQGQQYNHTRDWDMIDLIRQGRANELRSQVTKDMQEGKLGSYDISGTKYYRDTDNNTVTWLTAENAEDSQNNQIAKRVLEKIDALEAFVIGNNANLSDDQLFEKMVLRDARYLSYKNASHITGYYEEFKNRLRRIAEAESALASGKKTKTGDPNSKDLITDEEERNLKGDPLEARNKVLAQLQANVDQAKKDLDLFLSGDVSLEYTRKLGFALDPKLNSLFLDLDYKKWLEEKVTSLEELDADVLKREQLQREWIEVYKKKILEDGAMDKAFYSYLALEKILQNPLLRQQELEQAYKQFHAVVEKMKNDENLMRKNFFKDENKLYNWDSKLINEEGIEESEEDYNNRGNLDLYGRVQRGYRMQSLNNQAWSNFIQQFDQYLQAINYEVDGNLNRTISQLLAIRDKEVLNELIFALPYADQGTISVAVEKVKDQIQGLKPDLSNLESIQTKMFNAFHQAIGSEIKGFKASLQALAPAKGDLAYYSYYDQPEVLISNLEEDGKIDEANIVKELISKAASFDEGSQEHNDYVEQLDNYIKTLDTKYSIYEEEVSATQVLEQFIGKYRKLTIAQVINELSNPESGIISYLNSLGSHFAPAILDKLSNTTFSFSKDTPLSILGNGVDYSTYSNQALDLQRKTLQQYLDFISQSYSQHPLVQFQQKIKTTQKSPLQEMFKIISKQTANNNQEIADINGILDQVYQDYVEQTDINKFHLNSTQQQLLDTAKKTLDLVSAYVYSISNPTEQGDYFGHTSAINAFAKEHQKELTKTWEPLPEISNDYGAVLNAEADRLNLEIARWQDISSANIMNKTRRLFNTEAAYNKAKANLIKALGKKIMVGEKEYDLSEGLTTSDTGLQGLATVEQQFYKNFMNAVLDSGLSYSDFFKQSNFWEQMLPDKVLDILSQKTTTLDEKLQKFTAYDQAIKVLELIAEDPYKYYQGLSNFVKDNKGIVPLTIQQVGSRLGQAAHSEIYQEGFKALAKYLEIDDLNVVPEMVHIDGTAGAGKTEVLLKAIRQRFYDEKALVIAPSEKQSKKLANILGESSYYTIDNSRDDYIFKKLIPQWDAINAEYESAVTSLEESLNKGKHASIDMAHFTARTHADASGHYRIVFDLKDNIAFNKDFDQTLVFIDEAAHLNPFQLVVLGKFAQQNKGVVYAASDKHQDGFKSNVMDSLEASTFFITKTSRLVESLRSGNIQKQKNGALLDAILDSWDNIQTKPVTEIEKFLVNLPNTLKGVNLAVYNKADDINGDLLGADINEVIKVLDKHKKDSELGFIGNENSPIFTTLKSLGFNIQALTEQRVAGKAHMQGDEFDYVIVDKLNNVPEVGVSPYKYLEFLKRFNTLSTRSKTATIFIDDFKDILGENKEETIKSPGFDISESIEEYRKPYLKSLEELKLEPVTFDKTVKKEKKEAKPVGNGEFELSGDLNLSSNSEVNLTEEELETKKINDREALLQALQEVEQDISLGDYTPNVTMDQLDLFVEANLTAPNIGLSWTDTQDNGESRIYRKWFRAPVPKKGEVRRNASAFVFGDGGFSGIKDKQQIERDLSSIQSAIIYGGDPKGAIRNFANFGNVWSKRKLMLEIREATDSDFFGTGTGLEPTFIKIGDKRYVMAVVLKLEGLRQHAESHAFDALIDISFMNDPNRLSKKEVQEQIKTNLEEKLAKGVIAEDRRTEVQHFINNLEEIGRQWKEFAKTIVENELSEDKTSFTIDLDTDMYDSNKMTSLHSIPYPKRLGGRLNLQDVAHRANTIIEKDEDTGKFVEKYPEDWNTFLDQDTRKVVSPVYIFGEKSTVLEGIIDDSLFGKSVVFVSGNTNLSPDVLADKWLQQRTGESTHTPEVRAVVLNNHGVSFSELITHKIQDQFPGQGKPHRMDVLGVRMFTALWNFRAALQKFKKALESWEYSKSSKLDAMLSAEADLYNKFKDDGWHNNWETILNTRQDEVQEVLNKYGNVLPEDIKKLMIFNFENTKDVPIFRLGTDFTSKQSGGYVRPFQIKEGSTAYNKRQANLIALPISSVEKFNIMLDTILEQLTTNKSPEAYKNSTIDYKPVGIRVANPDGTDLSTDQMLGNEDRKTTDMIRTTGDGIIFGEKDPNDPEKFIWQYDIKNGDLFSFLPKILVSMVNGVKFYQKEQFAGHLSISTVRTEDKKDVKSSVNIDIEGFFQKGGITKDVSDNSLLHMLNLVFHGTNGSIENNIRTGEKRAPYTEEAPFKYGILVDPEIKIVDNYKQLNKLGEDGKEWTLLLCGTNPIFFDVNVEVRPGGIRVNLSKVMDKYYGRIREEAKKEIERKKPDSTKKVVFSDSITDVNSKNEFIGEVLEGNYENSEEGYNKFLYNKKWSLLDNVFSDRVKYSSGDEMLETIKKHINEELGENVVAVLESTDSGYKFYDSMGQPLDIVKNKLSNSLEWKNKGVQNVIPINNEISEEQEVQKDDESSPFKVAPKGLKINHDNFRSAIIQILPEGEQNLRTLLATSNYEEYIEFISKEETKGLINNILNDEKAKEVIKNLNIDNITTRSLRQYLRNINNC